MGINTLKHRLKFALLEMHVNTCTELLMHSNLVMHIIVAMYDAFFLPNNMF